MSRNRTAKTPRRVARRSNPSNRAAAPFAQEIAAASRTSDRIYRDASILERASARARLVSELVPETGNTMYPLAWLIATGRVDGAFCRALLEIAPAAFGKIAARIHADLNGHSVQVIASAWTDAVAAGRGALRRPNPPRGAPLRIRRVLEVVDTREWVQGPDDRWVAIPGSGDARECSRCGRVHEVHAHVELDDGSQAVVGTGCAARDAMDLAPLLRSGEARAKRLAEIDARIARAQAMARELHRVESEVARLPMPPVRTWENPERPGRFTWAVGDAECTGTPSHSREERERCARNGWLFRRMQERGITYDHRSADSVVDDLERKRARLVSADRNAP